MSLFSGAAKWEKPFEQIFGNKRDSKEASIDARMEIATGEKEKAKRAEEIARKLIEIQNSDSLNKTRALEDVHEMQRAYINKEYGVKNELQGTTQLVKQYFKLQEKEIPAYQRTPEIQKDLAQGMLSKLYPLKYPTKERA